MVHATGEPANASSSTSRSTWGRCRGVPPRSWLALKNAQTSTSAFSRTTPVRTAVTAIPGRSDADRLLEVQRPGRVEHELADQPIRGASQRQLPIRLDGFGQVDQSFGPLTPHLRGTFAVGNRQRRDDGHQLRLLGVHHRLGRRRARHLQRGDLTRRQHTRACCVGDRRERVQEAATMHQPCCVTVAHPATVTQPRRHRHRPISGPLAAHLQATRSQRQTGRLAFMGGPRRRRTRQPTTRPRRAGPQRSP